MREAEIIFKKALGEIAALNGNAIDLVNNLETGKKLVDSALGMAREDYYQSEVNKNKPSPSEAE